MSRPVSFRDVIKCLNYLGHSGINEIHLLPRSQDELVKPILHELGIDINKPIYVQAYKHRDMDNNVGIGFRYNGTIRSDRAWATGKHCDVMERISITAFSDLSLTRELCSLVGRTIDLADHDGAYTMDDETDSSQFIVETYEADSKMIKHLNAICKTIRGDE